MEISPSSLDDVKPGTRVCAYWSQQYRCLYPGRSAALTDSGSSPSTLTNNNTFLSVEFDDGDSGRIRLENIRFLMSDYPNIGKRSHILDLLYLIPLIIKIEYDSFPLTTSFAKPKDKDDNDPQRIKELSTLKFSPKIELADESFVSENDDKDKSIKLKSTSRKHKSESDEPRKHRKHKKKKKHKKRRKNIYEVVTQEETILSAAYKDVNEHSLESPNSETSLPSNPSDEIESRMENMNNNAVLDLNEEDEEIACRYNDNSSNYSSNDKVSQLFLKF